MALLAVWGWLWFLSGVRRSLGYAGYRDSRIITRGILKLAFGGALFAAVWYPPHDWPREVHQGLMWLRTMPYTRGAVLAVVIWLAATALCKLALVLWIRFSHAREQVRDDIAANEFRWD